MNLLTQARPDQESKGRPYRSTEGDRGVQGEEGERIQGV
jgi:hypothetical protein